MVCESYRVQCKITLITMNKFPRSQCFYSWFVFIVCERHRMQFRNAKHEFCWLPMCCVCVVVVYVFMLLLLLLLLFRPRLWLLMILLCMVRGP